ncbi:MAG: aspartate:alanine exchanger family transporter [Bacteroidales bacterium]
MESLLSEGYFVLFVIIALGIMLGNLRIKGFSLDLSAVIFIALLAGHWGYMVPENLKTIGLVFFIFTIGMQAGPGFFDAFRQHGRDLISVGTILVGSAAVLSLVFSAILDIEKNIAVGIFNGALTSTPGLAAAIDATGSSDAAVGYGLAYPLGTIAVILFIQLAPRILKVNIQKEEKDFEDQILEEHPKIFNKKFIVENPNIFGKTLSALEIGTMTHAVMSRIKHNGEIFTPTPDTVLEKGDIVKVVGTEEALDRASVIIGPETDIDLTFSKNYKAEWLLVTNKKMVGKSFREINFKAYGATVTRIRRSGIDIIPGPHNRLRFGDKLLLVAPASDLKNIQKLLGNSEKRLSETNFLPIALGIIVGVLLGQITIPVLGIFDFRLGITGGVLTAAIVLSALGKTGPIIWSMSGSAIMILRKLGLLLFMAAVGTHAGATLADTIADQGFQLVGIGAIITIAPMVITLLLGHYVFKMNHLSLLGVISGSMTSTPGLSAIDSQTTSNAPSVGYATVYPVALVLMIIFSQIMVKIL